MHTYRLALIGFGNVGQGLAQILQEHGQRIAEQFGVKITLTAVCDMLKGSLYNPDGLDPAALLEAARQGNLEKLPAPQRGWDALTTIRESNANVLAEASYTDLTTGEPATSHIRAALQKGMHVITTNKGPVALHYAELAALAQQKGVQIGAEGTVMSGTPTLRLGLDLLAGAGIRKVQGILNGTTNFILTQMDMGASYADALAEAQGRGYAEADPTGDVEGYDAAGKAVILANLMMGANLSLKDVARQGITGIRPADIETAQVAGERWKLVATIEKENETVRASVCPTRLPLEHPLAGIGGATNAATFTTEILGEVTLVGPGAGRMETGYALVEDLLAISRSGK